MLRLFAAIYVFGADHANPAGTILLLLSPFVHALLTILAIICSDILPQSPGGVATTDVVANRKLLWKFSRNYSADHMVIYQSFCPLRSKHQGMST